MSYQFPTFKFYLAGLVVLILFFFFVWFPKAQIDLIVSSEPLIMSFEIKLDTLARKTLFNLDTLPARIIISQDQEVWSDYQFINELKSEETGQMFVFQKKDLKELVAYKAQSSLNESKQESINNSQLPGIELGKQVFEFHPEKWEIEVLKKDFSAGQGIISILLKEEVIREYDFDKLKQDIRFKRVKLVKQDLEDILSIRKAKIKLRPWFWKQTPLFSNRINFTVKPVGE